MRCNKRGSQRIDCAGLLSCHPLIKANFWYGLEVKAAGVDYLKELEARDHGNSHQCWRKKYQRDQIKYCSWAHSCFFPSLILSLKHREPYWLAGVGQHCSHRKKLGYRMEMRTGVKGDDIH